MPVPKRKRSRARRDSRFANKGMKEGSISTCANCKVALVPHQACKACGFYKGIKILSVKSERQVRRLELRKTQEASRKARAAGEGKIEDPSSEL